MIENENSYMKLVKNIKINFVFFILIQKIMSKDTKNLHSIFILLFSKHDIIL